MSLLLPIEGPGFECKLYLGPIADRLFGSHSVDVERASCHPDILDLSALVLFRRSNESGRQETGIYFSPPEHESTSEMLRFFSDKEGDIGHEAALSLFEELFERLGYEEMLVAMDAQMDGLKDVKYGCCKCGDSALWELRRITRVPGAENLSAISALFACNEHVEEALAEMNRRSKGGWQSRFVGGTGEDGNEMTISDD